MGCSALYSKRLCWLGRLTKSSPSVLTCARCPLSGALQSGGGWRAVGSGSTELTWSLAVDSPGPLPGMRAFYLLVTRVMMGIAARRLATFVGADGDAPRQ